jgi:hypothetical protein
LIAVVPTKRGKRIINLTGVRCVTARNTLGESLNRRRFLWNTAAAALAAKAIPARGAEITLELPAANAAWKAVPSDFVGLSYESGQLYNRDFFSAKNTPLVAAFRSLTPKGVLRMGGHLSNITPWEGVGQDDPRQIRGVRHGIDDYWEWPLVDPTVQRNKHGIITHAALRNLRGFLDAVDWRLLYGLNFASGSAERAADEAAAVRELVGDRLIAFVIGNEVDGFGDDPVFRQKGYSFSQYIDEYETWVKTIRRRVPAAKFAGPDTDGKVDSWVLEFAQRTRGDVVLLTSHYYGMGPASAPGMTAERLLRKDTQKLDAEIDAVHAAQTAAGGTPYRMDEGNSCFGGGKEGVSDAYASALWAADYLLRAACAGFAGVNLHGGGVGIYTPVESSAHAPAMPRPVYFGMQFAQRFAGGRVAACNMRTAANVTAYQGLKDGHTLLAFINKGPNAVAVKLPVAMKGAKRWELTGPSLEAKSGTAFRMAGRTEASSLHIAAYCGVLLEA